MFDTPSPQQRSGHDFNADPLKGTAVITYRAGKLEEVSSRMFFENRLTPADLVQGFEYYDKEQQARVKLPAFTAYVLGVYYGSFSNGQEKGDMRIVATYNPGNLARSFKTLTFRYFSNLVPNTKTDILQCSYFLQDKRHTLAIGNYKTDIVPALEKEGRNGGYTRVIVAYIPEFKEVRAIHLGATAEAGFVKAVAKARGIEEHKASLFDVGQLTSEIWVFQYAGQSEPVVFSPKDARNVPATVPATAKNKVIYFQPSLVCGVIKETNEKYSEAFRSVSAMQAEYANYIASEQAYLREVWEKGGNVSYGPATAQPAAHVQAADEFPTRDLTDYEDSRPGNVDDLPF